MNDILQYFVSSLASKTLSLKKKGLLVDKPWTLVNQEGHLQKLIFRRDNTLILSHEGVVKEGTWEYLPEAHSLLVDRVSDKLLLNEKYLDENVLILKKDGTKNDFFALANENSLADLDIPKYLYSLHVDQLKISEKTLYGGRTLQIINGQKVSEIYDYPGKSVEWVNSQYESEMVEDGNYLSADRNETINIQSGIIRSVKKNLLKVFDDGTQLEIVEGNENDEFNVGKAVTLNGMPLENIRLQSKNLLYRIIKGSIVRVSYINTHFLKDGTLLKIEQFEFNRISSGDEILEPKLPDGDYKLKGRLWKINVKDNVVQ